MRQFDPSGAVADELEVALGIGFLRHSSKKPSGDADALQARFGCDTSEMVMLGGGEGTSWRVMMYAVMKRKRNDTT